MIATVERKVKVKPNYAVDDADDDAALLELARSRMNGEFTGGSEYRRFLKNCINELRSRKEGL